MNKYSVVLLDIDGTLLDSRNEISGNTKKLLKRLEKKGVPVVLASAGMPGEVERVARQASVHAPVISYGGSLILDESRSMIADTGIERETALAFKAFADSDFPDVAVSSYIYDIWLVDNPNDEQIKRLAERSQREPLQGALVSAVRMTDHVHKFLCAGTPRRVQELKVRAETEFPTLHCTLSGGVYLEAFQRGASKCEAMEAIARYYRIGAEQIVAVGDDYADMETLRAAGMGIAMGNAPAAVRRAAKRVTADNDGDGVYIALKGLRFQSPSDERESD